MKPIVQNRVSLQNLKVAAFASEETLCFSATVLFDGYPVADAKNEGHGGCTFLRPVQGAAERLAAAEAFAKTLPVVENEYTNSRTGEVRKFDIDVTLEFLVDHLASQMDADRRIRTAFNRSIISRLLFVTNNELRYVKGVNLKTVRDRAALFASLRKKHGNDVVILAELPRKQAFALWEKYAVDQELS